MTRGGTTGRPPGRHFRATSSDSRPRPRRRGRWQVPSTAARSAATKGRAWPRPRWRAARSGGRRCEVVGLGTHHPRLRPGFRRSRSRKSARASRSSLSSYPEAPSSTGGSDRRRPPVAGEHPGGAFPGRARLAGPGSAPRSPPSPRSMGLSPARGVRRGSRPGVSSSRRRPASQASRRRRAPAYALRVFGLTEAATSRRAAGAGPLSAAAAGRVGAGGSIFTTDAGLELAVRRDPHDEGVDQAGSRGPRASPRASGRWPLRRSGTRPGRRRGRARPRPQRFCPFGSRGVRVRGPPGQSSRRPAMTIASSLSAMPANYSP